MPLPVYYADAANPWFTWQFLRDNPDTILAALREHVSLTAEAVVLAALVAVPLAVLGYWFRPLTGPILALTGVLYTIPSLALFALLAPFLGVGQVTVLAGLVTYALLVIVRNTVAGLTQVPEAVRDAARGMGYGRLAQLWRIELPLALPGIMTGIRLATVSTVALVTVGVLVGHGGLGQLLTAGFRAGYRAEVMTATIVVFVLGLVLDLLLAGLGWLLTPWARRRVA
jgi:ABC-type proline/glycine betaine transport systems, permease component